MTKTITDVLGITDPLSLAAYRLAVTSSQGMKSSIYAFNMINALMDRVDTLEQALAEKPKAATRRKATESE